MLDYDIRGKGLTAVRVGNTQSYMSTPSAEHTTKSTAYLDRIDHDNSLIDMLRKADKAPKVIFQRKIESLGCSSIRR